MTMVTPKTRLATVIYELVHRFRCLTDWQGYYWRGVFLDQTKDWDWHAKVYHHKRWCRGQPVWSLGKPASQPNQYYNSPPYT